jgi:murein DD-endopeptidase MepM/ murein hydrolase activator NlpD
MRRILLIVFVTAVAGWMYWLGADGVAEIPRLFSASPHERYSARLRLTGRSGTPAARAWLTAAEQSLDRPARVALAETPLESAVENAAAFELSLRRGERFMVTTSHIMFIDLFRRVDGELRRVTSAGPDSGRLEAEIRADGEYVLRVQPRLIVDAGESTDVSATVELDAGPTLIVPVERASPQNIQSFFGAARDGGRRQHDGVDIFAPRGTPVLAAAEGIVSFVGDNDLGGRVVWTTRPRHRESLYYAHLDTQSVSVGEVVDAGDVIGTVGNSGNARSTAPHLHFGIYAPGGAVDPLPYIVGRSHTSLLAH